MICQYIKVNSMKSLTLCPVCNQPLDYYIQEYPAKYNMKPLKVYTCINKGNCVEAGLNGLTGVQATWLLKYPHMKFED